MKRVALNYAVDIGLIVSFLVNFVSGLIKFLAMNDLIISPFPRAELTFWHDWSGIIMGVLILAHIVLHWNWIIAMTKKYLGMK